MELHRISTVQVIAFHTEMDQISSSAHSDTIDLSKSWEIAAQILLPLIPSDFNLNAQLPKTSAYIHMCCLTAQFLCLGLVSFCQGHVGPIELFFINRPQWRSVLLGNHVLNEDGWHQVPQIVVGLSKLTCLGQMIEGPLITFSMSTGQLEEDMTMHGSGAGPMVDDASPRQSELDITDMVANEREHHMKATADDIVRTWGPGRFITSEIDGSLLQAVCVGSGIIYCKDGAANEFHWEAGPGPIQLPQVFFHKQSKLIVGTPVVDNPIQCVFPWQDWRARCRLIYLGVEPERWDPNQRQLGLQIGPDHAAFQGNQMWTKVPAKLLKQYQLQQEQSELVDFLGCYVGVQVSCCTGVARRVTMQKLLADLVPTFCQTYMTQAGWNGWNNQYNVLAGLDSQDFSTWLFDLRRQSTEACQNLLGAVHRVLKILEPTGLSRDRKYVQIAWPKEGEFHRGIRVSCRDESLWAQILMDSKEGVTFAYMTNACLLSDGNHCQQQSQVWRITTKCLGTAVARYRNEFEQEPEPTTWALQNGRSYHMWNTKGYIRLKADTSGLETRLIVSRSAVPKFMSIRQFRGKHYRGECLLREHHHPDDDAREVLILSEGNCER